MRILVTFALETEFAPWRAIREFRDTMLGGGKACAARIGGAEIAVVLTGVGRRQAALRASRAIRGESDTFALCISSGLAGAIRPQYGIAQVLAARGVIDSLPGEEAGREPLLSSGPLLSFAAECGATVVDKFYTANRVVARVDEKAHLGLTADAVEMESFEILQESAVAGIPAIAIRGVSDLAGEELPLDMNRIFTEEGEISLPRVAGQVALHPQSVPALVKLGQNSRRAGEELTRFLDKYIIMVVDRMNALEVKAGTNQ